VNRRTLLGAWSVPVILATTATPVRAASVEPPLPTNVCQDGRVTFSSDRKNTRADHLTISNHTDAPVFLAGWVQTSAQVRVHAVQVTGGESSGFIVADSPNKASGVLVVPARGWLTVQVVTEKPNAEAHIYLDCGREFLVKSIQAGGAA
jgi:hypothetical protein